MQTLCLKRRDIDLKDYCKRRAQESDCTTLITDEFKLVDEDTGEVVALYCKPQSEDEIFNDIFDACVEVKYFKDYRSSGLATTSRVFGYNPRNEVRRKYSCTAATLAHETPSLHGRVLRGGALAAKYYALHNADLYQQHLQTTSEKISEDWRLPEVPFTSGIINDNNPLCYHFDTGNFKKVWSAMIVLKRKISGGYLAMPEYDVMVEVLNHSIFYFDGQSILHGVTPIKKMAADARRFSLVYDSLQQMWNCQPLREEIARARMARQEAEERRRNAHVK